MAREAQQNGGVAQQGSRAAAAAGAGPAGYKPIKDSHPDATADAIAFPVAAAIAAAWRASTRAGLVAAQPKRPRRMGLCSEVADDGEKSGGPTRPSQLIREPQVLVPTPGSP
jgi:hypothetical protein